jgi:hypothetical protein
LNDGDVLNCILYVNLSGMNDTNYPCNTCRANYYRTVNKRFKCLNDITNCIIYDNLDDINDTT